MLDSGSGDNKDIGLESGNTVPLNSNSFEENLSNPSLASDPSANMRDGSGGIVVARGTGDGLILRLDGRVERPILMRTLLEYVESRKSFFSGQEVTLEWVEARPEEGVVAELSDSLASRFQLLVKASRMFERGSKAVSTAKKPTSGISGSIETDDFTGSPAASNRLRPTPVSPKLSERVPNAQISNPSVFGTGSTSLFDGVTALSSSSQNYPSGAQVNSVQERRLASEALLWDEADTRIIRDTLRGGQKIESEHSVVIMGDVNSGAEIVAGGDIFVLGRLRGVAHAGAYDESGGGRRIFALQMQPTQLRIGSIISQGSDEGGRMPEVAKIEGNMIVVEPYGAGSQVKRLR